MIQEERPQVTITTNDLILMQLKDLKDGQRDLKAEIKDIRQELSDVRKEMNDVRKEINDARKEINEVRKEVNERIDRLADKIDSSSNHGQIATISSVGVGLSAVSITLGVLYAIFFK